MPPLLPRILSIQLNQSGGGGRASATLLITNNTTGDTGTTTTNASGQALFDLANLTNGYTNGDSITVNQVTSDSDMEYFVTNNGNQTNPTFVQVENGSSGSFILNTARFKLNLSRHAGGIDINITTA